MFHYLFTNDLRISTLENSLKRAGTCFSTDTVPSATENKNDNNNMMTLGFYFNLTQTSNCAKLCSEGKIRTVVLNFIKKFQFPNPRTMESFNDAVNDKINLAPLRLILQVLYFMKMQAPSDAYLTREEITNFIFYNHDIAKTLTPNVPALITQIIDFRKSGILPQNIENDETKRNWAQCERQVREMTKVLTWSGCVTEVENSKLIIQHDKLSTSNKADLFDIVTYNNFWKYSDFSSLKEAKASYQIYMDITDAEIAADNFDETGNGFEDVLNHNLYGIHIKEENDALSETDPHICIGWSCLADLTGIDSREALGQRYDEHIQKEPRGRGQDLGQIWRFFKETNIGDYVVFADDSVCHIGRIESDYIYDATERPNENPDYANRRIVTWLKKDIPRSSLSSAFHRSLMTAMSYWGLNDYKSSVVELLKGTYKKDIIDDLGEVKETEGVRMITFESNINCDLPRNRILFGAPGTGKSHTLDKETDELIKSMNGEYERVTFHPDYSYANFVGTYKPVPSADGITYKYVPGPFMRVLKKALENANNPDATPRPFVLVIEEINRANVAAVFGDVFQLLDRNGKNISDYSIQASEDLKTHLAEVLGGNPESYAELKIPNNMFIWATMNSADQGVFPMDTAFKRRWDFTYLGIDNGDENIVGKTVMLGKGDYKRVVEWNKLRKAINSVLSSKDFKINEDKLMGPYFLSTKVIPLDGEIDAKKFTDAFKSKVIMYLFEDAAKQKKHTLFSGCSDTTRYSSIRDEFDTKGVFIFCDEIHNKFPASESGEGESE